jgi:hypothetical protein
MDKRFQLIAYRVCYIYLLFKTQNSGRGGRDQRNPEKSFETPEADSPLLCLCDTYLDKM